MLSIIVVEETNIVIHKYIYIYTRIHFNEDEKIEEEEKQRSHEIASVKEMRTPRKEENEEKNNKYRFFRMKILKWIGETENENE